MQSALNTTAPAAQLFHHAVDTAPWETKGTSHFGRYLGTFKSFMGVNLIQRLLEPCLPPIYTSRRPLEPMELLSHLAKDTVPAAQVRTGFPH